MPFDIISFFSATAIGMLVRFRRNEVKYHPFIFSLSSGPLSANDSFDRVLVPGYLFRLWTDRYSAGVIRWWLMVMSKGNSSYFTTGNFSLLFYLLEWTRFFRKCRELNRASQFLFFYLCLDQLSDIFIRNNYLKWCSWKANKLNFVMMESAKLNADRKKTNMRQWILQYLKQNRQHVPLEQ